LFSQNRSGSVVWKRAAVVVMLAVLATAVAAQVRCVLHCYCDFQPRYHAIALDNDVFPQSRSAGGRRAPAQPQPAEPIKQVNHV
jgi:hypothetical protein